MVGMFTSAHAIVLTEAEQQELRARARARRLRASDSQRAKLILLLAANAPYRTIQEHLGCSQMFISRWRHRFVQARLAGLYGRYVGRRPAPEAARLEARILNRTRQPPPDGSTHWSTRKLAAHLGVSRNRVARVWARARLKPHRLQRYMASDDPDFERKAADIIGLYSNPPQHAVIFCLDEKTAIQALDRRDPLLPMSPGRAERHGFEYHRHGTLSLYAALNTRTGEVLGRTVDRHTSEEFVAFLSSVVAAAPKGQALHVILDNLSTHKTRRVTDFLALHPNVQLHFTPTYSSWLNQVELWFSKIEREVIARGIFTSKADLKRQLMRYIRTSNRTAKPIRWSYSDPTHRIRANHSAGTVH